MQINSGWDTLVYGYEVEECHPSPPEPCRDDGFETGIQRKHKRDYGEDRNAMPGAGKHAAGRVRKKSKAVAKRRK